MPIDNKRPGVPKYKKELNNVNKIISLHYASIFKRIEAEYAKDPINISRINMILEDEFTHMDNATRKAIRQLVEKSFIEGEAQALIGDFHTTTRKEAEEELDKPTDIPQEQEEVNKLKAGGLAYLGLKTAKKIIKKDSMQEAKVNSLVDTIMDDLKKMDETTKKSITSLSRTIQNERNQFKLYEQAGYAEGMERISEGLTTKKIKERIAKEGLVGIVDKQGRRWKPGTYSKLVVKTNINDTYLEGVKHEGKRLGMDLGVISSHGAKDDCKKWEGVIISVNGQTPGYPTLADAKKSKEIFHPNCQHSVHMIRTQNHLPKEDQDRHERKVNKLSYKD